MNQALDIDIVQFDEQAAAESAISCLMAALSGANLVHDIGFLDCADLGSLEMLVMNDEIIAMTKRIMRGIEITDDQDAMLLFQRLLEQVEGSRHATQPPGIHKPPQGEVQLLGSRDAAITVDASQQRRHIGRQGVCVVSRFPALDQHLYFPRDVVRQSGVFGWSGKTKTPADSYQVTPCGSMQSGTSANDLRFSR